MKYADINTRYTAIVAEYMAKGYTINTRSMCGSQGDYAHIDLTDGAEVIRIMVDTFHEWADITLWNNRLDIISKERFYEIGADRYHGKFYGTLEDATAAQLLRRQRYMNRHQDSGSQDISPKAMEVAKRIIRREFGVKRICEADIKVSKHDGTYTIGYKGKAYRLH